MRTELRNNNASISAIKLQSGAIALAYNDVAFNEEVGRTVWPGAALPGDAGHFRGRRRDAAVAAHCGKRRGLCRSVERCQQPQLCEYPILAQSRSGEIHGVQPGKRKTSNM